jgi:hypothetical protein
MDAALNEDRRDGNRVPYASRVMIVRAESAWFAQLLDLSTGGCAVFRPDGCVLHEDEVVRLFFYQDGETAAVIVPARVARADDSRIGFEYHDPQTVPPTPPTR